MSIIGTKPEIKCTVNSLTVDVDELVEFAIVDLEVANKSFLRLWEQYFAGISEPDGWKYMYQEISDRVSALRILLDRITDDLLAAYGMAGDYHAARLALLSGNAKPDTNT